MLERQTAVVGPQRIGSNIFDNDRFASICSGAARTGRWAYGLAVHGSDVAFGQTGRRAVTHVHAVRVEQQDRDQHAWALLLDDAQKRIERLVKRLSLSDKLEHAVLPLQKLRAVFGCQFRLLVVRDVVKEDGESIGGRKNTIFVPAMPRLVIVLNLNEPLLSEGLFVRQMEGLPNTFRELRPNVLSNEVLRIPAEESSSLTVQIGVMPVFVESDNRITDAFKNIAKLGTCGGRLHANLVFLW